MAIAFAKLDSNNKVIRVFGIPDDKAATEAKGEAYLRKLYWETDTIYKRCDFYTVAGNHLKGGTPFRKNFPSGGWTYDPVRDAYVGIQPFPSWTFNEDTCRYDPPIPHPEGSASWNEADGKWDSVEA